MSEKVAFIGLGVMGFPMAGWLAKAGHAVTVFNRTRSKADAWADQYGGTAAATIADAAAGSDFVFSCVGDDPDLREVVLGGNGILASMAKGGIFVDHTTASAGIAREIAAAGEAGGIACIDAPVSGGQAGAENGQLTIMCGGDASAYASAEPIMDC
jgi:3-hydroxyisobutyrate dehydrogenase